MRIDQKPFSRTETEKGKAGQIKILQGIMPAELTKHRLAVECWKKMKDAEKVSASASRKEIREGDTLCIAPKALPNFQRATRIAIGKIVFRITESVPEIIGWYSDLVKMQRCLTHLQGLPRESRELFEYLVVSPSKAAVCFGLLG